jgi:glutathione S-transferase
MASSRRASRRSIRGSRCPCSSDSTRILEVAQELAGRQLDAGLDARALGEAWLWEELGDTALNGFLVAARWADDRNWPSTKEAYFGAMAWPVALFVPDSLRGGVKKNLVARDVWRAGPDACWSRFQTILDRLEARTPERGFWMGKTLGVADLGLFPQLHGLRTSLTPWQDGEVAKRQRLSAYLDRVHDATADVAPQLAESKPRSASAAIS